MKRVIFLFVVIMLSITANSANVYPFPVTVTQSDGTTLTVIGHGDEHFHWFTTIDGVLLCRVGSNFFVAETIDGDLIATKQLAHERHLRGSEELQLISMQDKNDFARIVNKRREAAHAKYEPIEMQSTFFPHEGQPRAVVILVDFNDVHFSVADPKKSFEQYLNGTGHPEDYGNRENRNYSSVAQYFDDMSYGKFRPQFDVYGPIRLTENSAVYGAGRSDRMDLFFPQVISAASNIVDFTQYDANSDGYVDLIYIIYAGYAASLTQNSEDCLWPKSGNREENIPNTSLRTYRFGISNELNGFPGAFTEEPLNRINGVGLFCHEFSHCLGLPDIYPTNSDIVSDNQAMEFWSLMDGGEYVDNGWCPAAFTAWEREALGWLQIEELTEDTSVKDMLPLNTQDGKAYRIRNDNDTEGNEYFIIENIQTTGWNTRQKGHGLLMYHVNYDKTKFSLTSNNVNNTAGRPNMAVVPADGLLASKKNINTVKPWGTGNNGKVTNQDYYNQLSGDPFPGTQNITSANELMGLPNFAVYNGTSLNKALTNISEEDGKISFTFISDFNSYQTGIKDLNNNTTDNKNIYTIDGRLINDTQSIKKGIYIKGNKKIVIK